LPCDETVPARLDARKLADRDPLHFGDGRTDLGQHVLFLIFRQRRPCFRAEDASQLRDDEIGPSVALAFEHDFRNRDSEPAAKQRQRASLRDKLATVYWRKNLQDQIVAETDDEIGPRREDVRRSRLQAVAARDIERHRQPTRSVRAPGPERLEVR